MICLNLLGDRSAPRVSTGWRCARRGAALLTLCFVTVGMADGGLAWGETPASAPANYVAPSSVEATSPAAVAAAMQRLASQSATAGKPDKPAAEVRWGGRFQPLDTTDGYEPSGEKSAARTTGKGEGTIVGETNAYAANRFQALPGGSAPVISSDESAPPQETSATRTISLNTLSRQPRTAMTIVSPPKDAIAPTRPAQQVSYHLPVHPLVQAPKLPPVESGYPGGYQRPANGLVAPGNAMSLPTTTASSGPATPITQAERAQLQQLQQAEARLSERFSSRRRYAGETLPPPQPTRAIDIVAPAPGSYAPADQYPPTHVVVAAPEPVRPTSQSARHAQAPMPQAQLPQAHVQAPPQAQAPPRVAPPAARQQVTLHRQPVQQQAAQYQAAAQQRAAAQNQLVSQHQPVLESMTSGPQPVRQAQFGEDDVNQPPATPQVPPPAFGQPGTLPGGQPGLQPPDRNDPFVDDAPLPGVMPEVGPQGEVQFDVIEHTKELSVTLRRSKLLRTTANIYRTAVVDPTICEVAQFTPREVAIIGRGQGTTNVTFWFKDDEHRPVTVLVNVSPDPAERRRLEDEYKLLEQMIAELFPDSKVRLTPMADKLVVRGQAKDSEEAAQIMAIIRRQSSGNQNSGFNGGYIQNGSAAEVLTSQETGRPSGPQLRVINMLRVPGEQQVALRVKIAELNRSAARGFGVDVDAKIDLSSMGSSDLFLQSMLNAAAGGTPSVLAQFDGDDISVGIRYLQKHGVIRLLSEPTLVTLSGRPATFVAGGEFAVPTIVGVSGVNAVTTDFRAFGAVISFLPTVIDKDRVRLQVAPEFSQVNSNLTVNGTPGLNVRSVTTTVEMREGQTLAIAGLLDDSMNATKEGDLPLLSKIFGRRDITRNETELIILVTPELVHPMEPEEVPPLPGFDVTEPTNLEFFLGGRLEGNPTKNYRSTIWPHLRRRYRAGGPAMISGPFGHGQ